LTAQAHTRSKFDTANAQETDAMGHQESMDHCRSYLQPFLAYWWQPIPCADSLMITTQVID
jgi:hypothetical protein